MNKLLLAVAATFAFSTAQAATPSVSFILGADDFAEIYIATSDTEQGSLIGTTSFFAGPLQTITGNLTFGVTNYIHILVQNNGGPDGISGEFTLSDTSFSFANGTQFLSTQPSTVNLSATGFGVDYQTPSSFGPISNAGEYYSNQYSQPFTTESLSGSGGPSYFSIPIYAVTAVPEPETYAMLVAGLGFVGVATRRRQINLN